MLGIVLTALLACGVTLGVVAGVRGRAIDRVDTPSLDPAELDDMATRLHGIEAEHVERQRRLLEVHLRPLVARRVPVQSVEPLPARRTNRVRFADGTAVTVKGETAGDPGVLAVAIRRHRVLPGTCSTDAFGTHLVFDWSGGRRHLSLIVTGLDQPD